MDLTNKAELKRVWIEALRSGEYEQTTGTLHNTDDGGFCCLGVAACVWGISDPDTMGVSVSRANENDEDIEGPTGVYRALDKVFLDDGRHKVVRKGVEMNDCGQPFTDIADMIERDWVVTEPEQ
jgi:hypothetical protein